MALRHRRAIERHPGGAAIRHCTRAPKASGGALEPRGRSLPVGLQQLGQVLQVRGQLPVHLLQRLTRQRALRGAGSSAAAASEHRGAETWRSRVWLPRKAADTVGRPRAPRRAVKFLNNRRRHVTQVRHQREACGGEARIQVHLRWAVRHELWARGKRLTRSDSGSTTPAEPMACAWTDPMSAALAETATAACGGRLSAAPSAEISLSSSESGSCSHTGHTQGMVGRAGKKERLRHTHHAQ